MRFKLIIFDLDETLWTIQQKILGPVKGPFRLINAHEAVGETANVRLFTGVRSLLNNLQRLHKHVSLASRSDPEICEELLQLFDIQQHFTYPQYGWQQKSHAVLNIMKAYHDVEKEVIKPGEVLFIDDWPSNVEAVQETGAATLLFGRDIRSIQELASILH